MTNEKQPDLVDAIEAQVGGDGDIGGIAQTITADDITAVLHSERSVDVRLLTLHDMRWDLEARISADRGTDIAPLIAEIDSAIATLEGSEDIAS